MKLYGFVLLSCALITTGCGHPVVIPDRPQLTPQVRLINELFRSNVLSRDMRLRIVVPAAQPQTGSAPVIYFLHGAGTDYRDWTNNSLIASFAAKNFVLVFPDEPDSYYINETSGKSRRYEDFFINELIPEVHRVVPYASQSRLDNAIVGISRGGYGAVVIGLKHSNMFSYVGDLSGALDFPERRFRWRTPWVSLANRKIFGPLGSPENQAIDPFVLIRTASASETPYFFVSCGDADSLLDPNRRFADVLSLRGFQSELHILQGGHNWDTWNADIPLLETSLQNHIHLQAGTTAK